MNIELRNNERAHMDQRLVPTGKNLEFELSGDGDEGNIVILLHKRGIDTKYLVAQSAIEYCVDDDKDPNEWENEVPLLEAFKSVVGKFDLNCAHCVTDDGRIIYTAVEENAEGALFMPVYVKSPYGGIPRPLIIEED